jgi:putative spermidine/putrescine transport system permease protein
MGGAWGSARAFYWLLIAPALLAMAAFYFFPLAKVLWISVTEPRPGLDNYALLVTSGSVHKVLLVTARICVITTAVTLLLGYVVAYVMVHATARHRRWLTFFVLLPLWVYANMQGIDLRLVAAARGLGASPVAAFRRVFLPLSRPGLVGAGVLVFIFSLGFYVTPAILGGGRVFMVAEYIGVQILTILRWGLATMLATTLLISVLLLMAALARLVNLRKLFAAG